MISYWNSPTFGSLNIKKNLCFSIEKGKNVRVSGAVEFFLTLIEFALQTKGLHFWLFLKDEGMIYIEDKSGTNIDVQIFDTAKLDCSKLDLNLSKKTAESGCSNYFC